LKIELRRASRIEPTGEPAFPGYEAGARGRRTPIRFCSRLTPVLTCSDGNHPNGEVLERILSRITTCVGIEVCSYNSTNRYFCGFNSLTIDEIVNGVRCRHHVLFAWP